MEDNYSQSKNGVFEPRESPEEETELQSNSGHPLPSQSDYEFDEEEGKVNYSPESYEQEKVGEGSGIEEFSRNKDFEEGENLERDSESQRFPEIDQENQDE